MNWICTVYIAVLFFVLTPGILVTLPPKSSKLIVAGFHAIVFALVWHFTHKMVWKLSSGREGFEEEEEEVEEEGYTEKKKEIIL